MNNFTKRDIKNGAVVELRNGKRFLKIDYTLLDINMTGEFVNIEHYKEDLTNIVREFDIMKILNPKENRVNENCCNLALCDIKEKDVNWTWERKETRKIKLKDMTMEQYAKWLQKNCCIGNCGNCIFNKVNCSNKNNCCWINNKELYSEKFLNQEIELEE